MNVRTSCVVFSTLTLCGLMAATAVAGLTRNIKPFVDEWIPRIAMLGRHVPVDYGAGPGRGRPRPPLLKGYQAAAPTQSGSVTGITLSNRGSYYFMPTCTIAPPNIASGQQATCHPYAFGLSAFPLSNSGTGYKVNDVLVMDARTGLNCPIYPALSVKAVDTTGKITMLAEYNAGMCLTVPSVGTYSFSGGAGTGYTTPAGAAGIRWSIAYAKVAGGSGYTTAPAVTFQSTAPFDRAVGTATIASDTLVPPTVPQGGPTAAMQGVFGTAIPWPINAIHMVLLPDGRVLNYGSDQDGEQTGALIYDIWDPALGMGTDAHLTLPNTTSTDIFCSASSVIWNTGKVMVTGGDLTVNGLRNYANNKTTIFSPTTNTIATGVQMHFPRWYPTIVPLANADKLVLGGWITRENGAAPVQPAAIPEVYHASTGWRSLSNVNVTDWYYPRAFVAPAGNIFTIAPSGAMSSITIQGTGALTAYTATAPISNSFVPTVMFAPGKLLSIRNSSVVMIDINGPNPLVTPTGNIDQLRQDASGTLLADGEVLVNGGSLVHNVLTGVAYTTQIWNPATGFWTTGAAATKPRLYHSNALLLPDGSVLTAGGGSPGPVINLNAEIYYPTYLYAKDGSGSAAQRPVILDAQAQGGIRVGAILGLTMGDASPVSRVTLLRAGAATHANNAEQRFLDVTPSVEQNRQQLSVTLPANANVLLPGYYLVFAFNQAGVPSVARQILITN